MKILPISFTTQNVTIQKKQLNTNPIEYSEKRNVFAYQDYNISFMGRTPEDFYAQDFNRKNMPKTMRDYLDYDYQTRQHIPPEQMMGEVFKYLNRVDNFEHVKGLYPQEDLFENLHENNIKSRKGILSEIAVAREVGDKPLLKNGSDNFGMYLLRKIYTEGKTLKEISKDFLEKDINDEYKGFITEPIDYSTLRAYGIKYPKQAFWHSFIHTRDEYKQFFVTLPKNSHIPGVHTGGSHSGSPASNNTDGNDSPRPKRKFGMQNHTKKQLQNDIKNKKVVNAEGLEKVIRRRLGKDDPEASFIIRYKSPIMTVAAERVHLSEEMKLFSEAEKMEGKNSDENSFFGRFWKRNPELLEQYSNSITDTIDMFEDIYGGGGNIAINTNLEQINPKDPNNKIIDFVSDEFYELLTYVQGIEPARNKRYIQHDQTKRELEEMFAQYDMEKAKEAELEASQIQPTENLSPEELLKDIAEKNGAAVYDIKLKSGNIISVTCNLDEVFEDSLKEISRSWPTKFANKYIRFMKSNPNITEKYKLSLAARNIIDIADDPQIMKSMDLELATIDYNLDFYARNIYEELCASAAIGDMLSKKFGSELNAKVYKVRAFDYKEFLNSASKTNDGKWLDSAIQDNKSTINELYEAYIKPLSNNEKNKLDILLTEMMSNYTPNEDTLLTSDMQKIMIMIKEGINSDKNKRALFRKYLHDVELPRHTYTRSFLDKELNDAQKLGKFEEMMSFILEDSFRVNNDDPFLLSLIGRQVFNRHQHKLSENMYNITTSKINNLSSQWRLYFENS